MYLEQGPLIAENEPTTHKRTAWWPTVPRRLSWPSGRVVSEVTLFLRLSEILCDILMTVVSEPTVCHDVCPASEQPQGLLIVKGCTAGCPFKSLNTTNRGLLVLWFLTVSSYHYFVTFQVSNYIICMQILTESRSRSRSRSLSRSWLIYFLLSTSGTARRRN
jgi:hypothetical protein